MIEVIPYEIGGKLYTGISVQLPKTTLLVISNDIGYIMCGALDVGLLNERLSDRQIIAGRAVGVKTLEELLNAPLESVTDEARKRGIIPGMTGKDALILFQA
ncbi:YunC family protein [Pradoshia sp.]|uniref:YunC family protein n=1 Tax=Pradoshia sp. TaxID=2651281 RepID=UPI003F05B042